MTKPFSTGQGLSARLVPVVILAVSAATTTFLITYDGGVPLFFVVASGLFTAVMAVVVLYAMASRITLDAAGVLTVRGLRRRNNPSVDLSRLQVARAVEEVSVDYSDDSRRVRVTRYLQLSDERGQEVRVDPHLWRRGDLLVAAVEAAAIARGMQVENGQLFGMVGAVLGSAGDEPAVLAPAETPPLPDRDLEFRPTPRRRFSLAGSGGVLGLLGVAFAGTGAGSSMLPGTALDRWPLALFPLVGVLMIVTAALLLLSAAGSRVVLRRDGLLTVWSLPWPRRVRLAELDRIEVTPGDHDASNGRVARQTPVVLVDRPGSRVELIGESWQDPGLLMPTLAAWAVRTGTPVDATTRAYLLEGSPPAPRGLRPATP